MKKRVLLVALAVAVWVLFAVFPSILMLAFGKVYVGENVNLGYMNDTYGNLEGYDYVTGLYREDGVWHFNGMVVLGSDVAGSDWVTFGALLVLSLVCVLLAWKSNVPILNFVFGAITFGAGAYYLGADMVFAGWINLLAIVMAVMCMLTGAIKLREA